MAMAMNAPLCASVGSVMASVWLCMALNAPLLASVGYGSGYAPLLWLCWVMTEAHSIGAVMDEDIDAIARRFTRAQTPIKSARSLASSGHKIIKFFLFPNSMLRARTGEYGLIPYLKYLKFFWIRIM